MIVTEVIRFFKLMHSYLSILEPICLTLVNPRKSLCLAQVLGNDRYATNRTSCSMLPRCVFATQISWALGVSFRTQVSQKETRNQYKDPYPRAALGILMSSPKTPVQVDLACRVMSRKRRPRMNIREVVLSVVDVVISLKCHCSSSDAKLVPNLLLLHVLAQRRDASSDIGEGSVLQADRQLVPACEHLLRLQFGIDR